MPYRPGRDRRTDIPKSQTRLGDCSVKPRACIAKDIRRLTTFVFPAKRIQHSQTPPSKKIKGKPPPQQLGGYRQLWNIIQKQDVTEGFASAQHHANRVRAKHCEWDPRAAFIEPNAG